MRRLARIALTAKAQLLIEHGAEEGRGVTRLALEFSEDGENWRAGKTIAFGNAVLFLVHDAIGAACALAAKEPR